MKKILFFATAAALFAACSSDDLGLKEQLQAQIEPGSVAFEVYTQKATTRGGVAGSLSTAEMKDYNADPSLASDFNKAGFGVFAYYTDNNEYDQRSVPNFMYNQQVTWNGTAWTYAPLVYWPNEYGNNANSDDQDKVTFFAYAPYIQVVPTSGKLAVVSNDAEEWGITSMTRNSNQGDPILKYIAQFRADRSVDLCWGMADGDDGLSWLTTQDGAPQDAIPNGTPWLNLYRPADAVGQKVKFTFKHALAQMRINIDAQVDEIAGTTGAANKTRVWVREVTFKGFALKGSLNLNNPEANTAKWLDYNGQNELVAEDVVVYDGRKDGKEGVAGAIATNEKLTGLNPAIVQDGVYAGTTKAEDPYMKGEDVKVNGVDPTGVGGTTFERTGVPGTPVDLFAQDATNANGTVDNSIFHVIPTDDNFEIEIVYDIETVSKNLAQNLSDGATKGSSIENRIRQAVSFGDETTIKAGKSYTINLHLGLNSVKLDAEVTPWLEEPAQHVDLPLNTPIYATQDKGATPAVIPVSLPYMGNYQFAIKGFDGGETVNGVLAATILNGWSTNASTNAWTNGYDLVTLTTKANPTTLQRTQTGTWTGAQSGKFAKITFTQSAHPLFMTGAATNGATTITLTRHNNADHTGASSDWTGAEDGVTTGWLTNATGGGDGSKYIKVWRNGIQLTHVTTAPGNSEFQFVDTGESDMKTATPQDW